MPSFGRSRFRLPRLSTVVRNLITALVAAYVAQLVLQNWLGVPIVSLLALTPGGVGIWQLLTFVLVDISNPLMFLLGLLFLWWALSPFERDFGPRRTLQLCLVAMLSASVPAYLLGFVIEGSPPLFGSSPLWYGGIAATAWLYREQPVSLFGALTMTARQLLWVLLGMSVLGFLASKDHTRLVAELGAMGGAIAYVRYLQRPRRKPTPKKPAVRHSNLRAIEGGGGAGDRPKWLN